MFNYKLTLSGYFSNKLSNDRVEFSGSAPLSWQEMAKTKRIRINPKSNFIQTKITILCY